ncbi:MAG: spore coat U domain-containing protein [Gammaproteobacteria bacterium]
MHRNLKYGLPALAALFAMLTSVDASAQQSRDLNVTATVPEVCVINSPATISLDFGTLTPTDAADEETTANFDYRCSDGTAVTIELDLGGDANATLAERFMTHTNGTDKLGYLLEKPDSTPWGDTASGTAYTATAQGLGTQDTVEIRGVITAAQKSAAPVGDYSDTVLITLLP